LFFPLEKEKKKKTKKKTDKKIEREKAAGKHLILALFKQSKESPYFK
jgi:hypothetical protein